MKVHVQDPRERARTLCGLSVEGLQNLDTKSVALDFEETMLRDQCSVCRTVGDHIQRRLNLGSATPNFGRDLPPGYRARDLE